MVRYDTDFYKLLDIFDPDTLEQDRNVIYAIWVNLTFCYFNPSWLLFARENGGEPEISLRFGIGTYLGDAITGPLKEFYVNAYKQVIADGKPWHHDYECSTPEKYRVCHQTALPFHNQSGIIVINSLTMERAHDIRERPPMPALKKLYRDQNGLITHAAIVDGFVVLTERNGTGCQIG
jgi:hypothetical protein